MENPKEATSVAQVNTILAPNRKMTKQTIFTLIPAVLLRILRVLQTSLIQLILRHVAVVAVVF
jgi:hypothetical protein